MFSLFALSPPFSSCLECPLPTSQGCEEWAKEEEEEEVGDGDLVVFNACIYVSP